MLEYLPIIPLFQDLGADQITLLKPLFEQYTCPLETTVFEQGEPATYLYLLIKGEISIRYKPYDGPSIILTRLHAGDVFGWSAVVGSAYYTSSIISDSNIEAIRIRGKHLIALVQKHPQTGKIIMDRLTSMVSPRWNNTHSQAQSLMNSDQE